MAMAIQGTVEGDDEGGLKVEDESEGKLYREGAEGALRLSPYSISPKAAAALRRKGHHL